jgi:hypothetical protein
MFPLGSLGVFQVTVKEVEFSEVAVSKRTSEGAKTHKT